MMWPLKMPCLLLLMAAISIHTTGQQYLTLSGPRGVVDSSARFTQATFSKVRQPSYTLNSPIPQDYYTRNFGFFCKQELKMHKAGLPVSVRLGSMEYCNMLEQKGH